MGRVEIANFISAVDSISCDMASIKSLRKARIRVRELRDTFEGHDASRCIQDVSRCTDVSDLSDLCRICPEVI